MMQEADLIGWLVHALGIIEAQTEFLDTVGLLSMYSHWHCSGNFRVSKMS